ncbi:tryptophan--tRNA ligase [Amycolatopsis anabasis]|uniref:tryptophan--tRNA ligase n=1 Tax=Amycolatopsis anabasis TaxID=1840409 RepID=UPI00131BE41F|nr:tryptophan--tRNA ligase [Amycolatopsis anabasis]
MSRLSGITPSGHVHIGNYLGALQRWVAEGGEDDLYFVSDLHAMTTTHNPAKLRALAGEQLAVLIAAGIPAERIFVQSDLARELGALTWVLECTASFGEAARMIQFKEKSKGQAGVRLSLLTYPVLMAADILLQGADEVPVGDDQRQHVELARALARRFNGTYGEVFTVPRAVLPPTGARIRDLADPARKMSKSTRDSAGVVFVLDEPELIRRKVRRAVTDGQSTLEYRPEDRPGLANLLEILAACTGARPEEVARRHTSYGELKDAVADAVIELLRPVREGANALLADPAELDRVRKAGAARAAERGEHRLQSALRLIGAG